MKSIFNMDGPVFDYLSKMADMVILNILFIICCIPIVTIGAALTAMSYVTLKMKDGEDGYVLKSFFKSFKQNFKQATVIWIIMLLFLILLVLDFNIVSGAGADGGMMWNVMRVIVLIGGIIWTMLLLYVFPVLARFDNTIRATMKNAMLMAFANAPKTLLTMAITIGAVVLTLWTSKTIAYGTLIWFLVGFGVISYINSAMQSKLFHKFMPEQEEVAMQAGSFSWENDEEWKQKLAEEEKSNAKE